MGHSAEQDVAAAADGSSKKANPSGAVYAFESHEFHASAAQKERMVQTIFESGVKEVPSRFLRTSAVETGAFSEAFVKDTNEQRTTKENGVPVIDLSGWMAGHDRDRVKDEVGKACAEWGFFQVVNHGIPVSVLEDAVRVALEFFHQPFEVKQEVAIKPGEYQGYGRVFEHEGAPSDWVDVMGHYLTPESMKKVDTQWPRNPTSYRDIMERYSTGLQHLVPQLLEIISLSLGLSPRYCQDLFGAEHIASLRINYYPPCPQPDSVLGLTAHSDGGYLSVLLQSSDIPGLEVEHRGQWYLVEPVPGALVVNVADILQVVSNSKYKSALHRAVVNNTRERVSLATFFQPTLDAVIKPAGELVSSSSPAEFREFVFSDYVTVYFSKKLDGKANLDTLRLKPNLDTQETLDV